MDQSKLHILLQEFNQNCGHVIERYFSPLASQIEKHRCDQSIDAVTYGLARLVAEDFRASVAQVNRTPETLSMFVNRAIASISQEPAAHKRLPIVLCAVQGGFTAAITETFSPIRPPVAITQQNNPTEYRRLVDLCLVAG